MTAFNPERGAFSPWASSAKREYYISRLVGDIERLARALKGTTLNEVGSDLYRYRYDFAEALKIVSASEDLIMSLANHDESVKTAIDCIDFTCRALATLGE